ncbi:MAG: hypothetical protein HYZ53_03455 [Planctomycetes bacterium]|nr:hypothetical protein [Planctomycetota bacterium]
MAKQLFGPSLIAELQRDYMHAKDIATVLEALTKRLDDEGIPFALIGALSMRHHGYVRYTEDIDILTTREGLERIHERLVGRGLRPRAEGLRKKLRDTEHQVNIDVLMAGENAGGTGSPVVFPDPRSDGFLVVEGRRVPDLRLLLSFKLCSGVWAHRGKDLGDVQELIKANHLTENFAEKLPPELRSHFLGILEQARLERDIE